MTLTKDCFKALTYPRLACYWYDSRYAVHFFSCIRFEFVIPQLPRLSGREVSGLRQYLIKTEWAYRGVPFQRTEIV
jgi:hypothetical protein